MSQETPQNPSATRALIVRWREGDSGAGDELTRLVYGNLRRLASSYMRSERPGHTLSPTSLVHEAYLRLACADLTIQDRAHFLAMAAREMRRVLVDHARSRSREKRGNGSLEQVTLDPSHWIAGSEAVDMLILQSALERLAKMDDRKSRLVDLMCFGGLTTDESALVLGVSPATVRRDWTLARAWLQHELRPTSTPAAV